MSFAFQLLFVTMLCSTTLGAAWPPSKDCQKLANAHCDTHCRPNLLSLCTGPMTAVADYGGGCSAGFKCVSSFSMLPGNTSYEAGTCKCDMSSELSTLFVGCGTVLPPPAPCPSPPRPYNGSGFLDVFTAGEVDDEGTKYACFRIPALIRTQSGRLLAFAEGRGGKSGCSDHGDVRLVLRASDDLGKTWGSIHTVHVEAGHTIGNPAPVVDNTTGMIHLLFSRDNKEVFTSMSADNGETWTTPINRTDVLKPTTQHDLWVATGPPGGIQLASGRLITAAYYNPPNGSTLSYAIFSDDHGKTWQRGADVGYGDAATLGESQIAYINTRHGGILTGGKLAMFIRAKAADSNYSSATHAIAISGDEGQTWEIPARMLADSENGPNCLGSVVGSDDALWLSAPSGSYSAPSARTGMSARFASAYGRTSYREMNLWDGPAAYSSMYLSGEAPSSDVPEFLILFERGFSSPYERLTFATSVPNFNPASQLADDQHLALV